MGDGGPLVYATPKKVRREIRKKDLVIVVLGLCAILAAVKWRTILDLSITTQSYRAQRRAMSFEPSPPRVAYTDDEAVARQVRPVDGAHVHPYRTNVAYYSSPAWAQMQELRDTNHLSGGYRGNATLFLHSRRAKGADQRLVVAEVMNVAVSSGGERRLDVLVHSIVPGSPASFWTDGDFREALEAQLAGADRMTFYTGQSDPADPAHFTIGYSINGKDGFLDGWLRANGRVDLKPRGGELSYEGIFWKP